MAIACMALGVLLLLALAALLSAETWRIFRTCWQYRIVTPELLLGLVAASILWTYLAAVLFGRS